MRKTWKRCLFSTSSWHFVDQYRCYRSLFRWTPTFPKPSIRQFQLWLTNEILPGVIKKRDLNLTDSECHLSILYLSFWHKCQHAETLLSVSKSPLLKVSMARYWGGTNATIYTQFTKSVSDCGRKFICTILINGDYFWSL